MWPAAIALSFMIAVISLLGTAAEVNHARADLRQQSQRYSEALLSNAQTAFVTQFNQTIQAGGTSPNPIPSTAPSPLCPSDSTQTPCNYYGSYSVATESGSGGIGVGGNETSSNIDTNAGENRWAALATATVTNSAGKTLAVRYRRFTVRTYGNGYDSFSGAAVVNSTDEAGSVTTDGDVAGCVGKSGGQTSCGDNTETQNYVGCYSSPAPNATAQRWENQSCVDANATPVPTPMPQSTMIPNSSYSNVQWNNGNAGSYGSSGWSP